MGYRLANIDGRAAFIDGDDFYDVARLSEGRLSSEPLAALREAKQLTEPWQTGSMLKHRMVSGVTD